MKTNNTLCIAISMTLCSIFASASAFAHSLFLTTSKVEQSVSFANNEVSFDPNGIGLQGVFDLNDSWSVSVDYAKWTDEKSMTPALSADFDVSSQGISLSYYQNNWSMSAYVSKWEDDIKIEHRRSHNVLLKETNDAPSYALSFNWGKEFSNWYISSTTSLHYNKWRRDESKLSRKLSERVIKQNSDILFFSASADTSYFLSLDENNGLILGGYLSWNQELESSEETVGEIRRHQGPVSTRANTRTQTRQLTNQLSSHLSNDSYGQFGLYTSYLFLEAWSLDITFSESFSTDHNASSISLSLGYSF